LLSYAPGVLSLSVFRKTMPDVKRPYRLPFASVLAPFAFIVTNLMVFWSGFAAIEIVVPLDLAGVVLLTVYRRHNRPSLRSVLYGIWMPAFMLFILGFSYIGSSFFGGINIIPFPWDSVIFILITILFYYIGLVSGVRGSKYFSGAEPKAS
ncbi:MAG TPA: amino acid transporter, partial [Thermoplasmataceae archaeon]|nr:amino acid transporter [Thermoplasmataceae archaeon]